MGLYAQAGYDAYASINFVVFLTQNMRQKTDSVYTDIMRRMRWGKLTDQDVKVLNRQTLCQSNPTTSEQLPDNSRFFYRPIVVALNSQRCAINTTMLHHLASLRHLTMYRFEAEPACSRTRMTSLRHLDDHLTERMPMTFEFVTGMPVMITRRHPMLNKADVIANGAIGFVIGFDYNSQDNSYEEKREGKINIQQLNRIPDMIYLQLRRCDRVLVAGFPPGVIGIPKHKYAVKITGANPRNHSATWTVTVTTFNMVPAFALTPEKLQGQTLSDGVAITELKRGTKKVPPQALYVAFSRIKRLQDLALVTLLTPEYLRKFHPDKHTVQEMRRLQSKVQCPPYAPQREVKMFETWRCIQEKNANED